MTTLILSAACLLDADQRLLLVRKRGTRAFMLPGGKREPGETALAALQRELLEELDLEMDASALQPLGRFRAPAANEPDTWVDAEIFVGRLSQPVAAAAELEELAWLAPGATPPADLAPLLHDQVLAALADHPGATALS